MINLLKRSVLDPALVLGGLELSGGGIDMDGYVLWTV